MAELRLTAKQARQLGLALGDGTTPADVEHVPTRRERWPYATVCMAPGCGESFTTQASETRHLEAVGHHRFELVL